MNLKRKKILSITIILSLVIGCIALTGCGGKDDKTIKVGASPAPHAEILKEVKSELEKDGYKLEIVEFQDYVQPNKALDAGDIDANYFQHKPYMDEFNAKQGTEIVSLGAIHYEPLGLYQGTKKSLDELVEGDKIAVPNDTTNEARALLLLESEGLIKLKKMPALQLQNRMLLRILKILKSWSLKLLLFQGACHLLLWE